MSEPVVIIGAGASGLMAAAALVDGGHPVLLLERAEQAGRKILASGGGRCNFTTDRNPKDFLAAWPGPGGRFLRPAIHHLPPDLLRQWFAGRGLQSVVEDRRCVFPASGRSRDLLAVLLQAADYRHTLRTNCEASGIVIADGRASAVRTSDGDTIAASAVIVAGGGPAWPQAGGTASGLLLLAQCGHTITPLRPALAPLISSPGWWTSVPGVTLEQVALSVGRVSLTGPAVTTHGGISGPVALDLSLRIETLPARVSLDLLPAESAERLAASLADSTAAGGQMLLRNWLAARLPRRLALALQASLDIPPEVALSQLRRAWRVVLLETLKRTQLEVVSLGDWKSAMVSVGGCKLSEVDPQSMQSRMVEGLYVTGESLDVAGPTGGFNLHAAFATGHLAARAIAGGDG